MNNRTRSCLPIMQFYMVVSVDKKPWLRVSIPIIRWMN